MATGIIAEYNPFHNGHKYMLEQIRSQFPKEPIIICMSGSITQRGEIAMLDKWTRARLAVLAGANLVFELPTVFACRSAQAFGEGGVRLLSATGIVDTLAFGTEYPDLAHLTHAAAFVPDEYPDELQALLKQGLSYGSAVTKLMSKKLSLHEVMLREPNTVLALEYLRCIKKLSDNSPAITPLPIRRTGAGHGDTLPKGSFASGTALRQMAVSNKDSDTLHKAIAPLVPPAVCDAIIQCRSYPDKAKLYQLLQYRLLTASPNELRKICGMGEGIEQAMLQAAGCAGYEEFVSALSSRRYPATRIQRLLIHLLLSTDRDMVNAMDAAGPLYGRVLAMDNAGRHLLKQIKNRGSLPLLNKVAGLLNRRDLLHPEALSLTQRMLYMDIAATNLHSLSLSQTSSFYEDYLHSPCYIDK